MFKTWFSLCLLFLVVVPVQPFASNHHQIVSKETFSPVVSQQNKITASRDGKVTWDGIYHNTHDPFYRSPGFGTTSGASKTGAVPVGTDVRLRLRTVANDTTSVTIRIWDGEHGQEILLPMSLFNSSNGYDYYQATVKSPAIPDDYYYAFMIKDGTDTVWYSDDGYTASSGRLQLDEGAGKVYSYHNYPTDFGIIFYDPSFKTPDWAKQGVGYQLFPDRFYNGYKGNDPNKTDITWFEWDSNGDGKFTSQDQQRVYANVKQWTDLPTSGDDFYGGDLQGVIQKTNYLHNLGVDFIWFNPIVDSPDYHGYSVNNYYAIDPYLGLIASRDNGVVKNNVSGGLQVFSDMVKSLNSSGIKVIFDTVLNHVSAQSQYFQRFENSNVSDSPTDFNVPDQYSSLGAYETPNSPYRNWFSFTGDNSNYDSWWGFKNIPTLKYSQNSSIAQELITGPNSVFTFWQKLGVKGFRLDVNNMYSDGDGSRLVNKLIRDRVKANDPNALIIGEIWDRANTWLTGNMNDAVQNMPFSDAVTDWLNGKITDAKLTDLLYFPIDSYCPASYSSLWTILDNHDTPRILTSLGGSISKMKMAVLMQFSYVGVPMIYYGDEVGVSGKNDPYNRRTFPWGSENQDILNYYKILTNARKSDVFSNTGFDVFSPASNIIALGRNLDVSGANNYSISIINNNPTTMSVKLNLSTYASVKPYDTLINVFDQKTYTVAENKLVTISVPASGGVLLFPMKITNSTTSQPSSSLDLTNTTSSNSNSQKASSGFEFIAIFSVLALVFKRKIRKSGK